MLTDNRLEMAALYFAIQRYGTAFCTINVDINAAHVREMLARMRPDLVLWHESPDADAFGKGEHAEWIRFGDCAPDRVSKHRTARHSARRRAARA